MARSNNIRDVAARAGVSVGTVSNAINRPDKVTPAVLQRVEIAIRDLGYVRNDAARQLRAGRSNTIAFAVLDVRNPFFTDVARGAESEAASAGMSVILGNSDEQEDREAAYLDLFEQQRVHGILISPYRDIGPRLAALRAKGTPVVLVDRMSKDLSISSVSVDDVAGARLAVEHLLAQGRRRVAYVGGPTEIRQVADRLKGARAAIAAHNGAKLETLSLNGLTVQEGRRVGEEIAIRRPEARPDAIFAANDLVATGLLQGLVMRSAVRVPDDIALVGYDDIDFASAAVVPITSVRQPSDLIGRTAVRILLDEAADPHLAARQIVFQPELVIRESSVTSARRRS